MKLAAREGQNLVEVILEKLKAEIFDFQLLPGDRFTETDMAGKMGVSRTPLREALFQLQREGFVEVHFRSGWQVRALDFQNLEELYDLRVVLELSAAERLCLNPERQQLLEALLPLWPLNGQVRVEQGQEVARQDEEFHAFLVGTTGNQEIQKVHQGLSERIRIIRRLDFSLPNRVAVTYQEHAAILKAILAGEASVAKALIQKHIEDSRNQVRDITIHRLYQARLERQD